MRAAFQILAVPYRIPGGAPFYCVFRRSDSGHWQFIAGGGEDDETPLEAAQREVFEECGARSGEWMELKSLSYIPAAAVAENERRHWGKGTYVIPEYAFGFECRENIVLSHEHTEYAWLPYNEIVEKLKWDSNRTAVYELNCRLTAMP